MQIEKAAVKIEGISPLLMHSGKMVDPSNEWTAKISAITSKPKKQRTDQDLLDMMEYEFQGGLYYDEELGPYIPAVNIEACIRDGATAQKRGKQVVAGLQVDPGRVKLLYDGPRHRSELYEDKNFRDVRPVKLRGSSVVRTRPRFEEWALDFTVRVFTDTVSLKTAKDALEISGIKKGLGDYKPKYGRFRVVKFEKV